MTLLRLNNDNTGVIGGLVQDLRYLVKGDTQAFVENDRGVFPHLMFNSFEAVLRDVPPGRNGTVFLSPNSWSLNAGLNWNKNLLHLIGIGPNLESNQFAIIKHSVNMSPMFTISGNGCLFKNIQFEYGLDDASNEVGVNITGNGNVFENCHFNGPVETAEAGDADFSMLKLSGTDNLFRNCTIGSDVEARSAANTLLTIEDGADRNIFDGCTFLSVSSSGDPVYIRIDSGVTIGKTTFRNCVGTNESTNWATDLTLAIDFAPATTAHRLVMDSSLFANATDIVASGKEPAVLYNSFHASTGVAVGLPINPDHTS